MCIRDSILGISLEDGGIRTVAHEPRMHQPNDIAIAPNGVLYALSLIHI